MVVQVVVLSFNGESRTVKPLTLSPDTIPTGALIAKVCRKTKPASAIGNYKWKNLIISLWGWKEGKAGSENKHELPPPHDEVLLFGDAVITASKDSKLTDFTKEQYDEFYNDTFKGFEDLDGEDEEEDEDAEYTEEENEQDVPVDIDEDVDDVEDVEETEDAEDVEEVEEDVEEDAEAEADVEDAEDAEAEDVDDDCYDDGEDGGGGKRRAPRRRTAQTPDNRRIDMGLRSRIKIPSPLGKRAPRWQTAPELEPEEY
jgi:hypothetical protein